MYIRFFVLSSVPSLPSASLSCQQAVEDLLLALTRVPQAVPQMVQTVVPFFSQVRRFLRHLRIFGSRVVLVCYLPKYFLPIYST